jgi:hypothetical protein
MSCLQLSLCLYLAPASACSIPRGYKQASSGLYYAHWLAHHPCNPCTTSIPPTPHTQRLGQREEAATHTLRKHSANPQSPQSSNTTTITYTAPTRTPTENHAYWPLHNTTPTTPPCGVACTTRQHGLRVCHAPRSPVHQQHLALQAGADGRLRAVLLWGITWNEQ